MRAHTLLAALCAIALAGTGGCNSRRAARAEAKELAQASAASEQLNVAFAAEVASKMITSTQKTYYPGSDTLTACDDRVDTRDWQTVRSPAVDMELPPEFVATTRSSGRGSSRVVEWRAPDGAYIRVDPGASGEPHYNWTGLITSECMVYISGARTHIDARRTVAGLGMHAVLTPESDGTGIAVEADRLSPKRLAEMLHALRTIRIAANWRDRS
jgi:hypothetical protein